MKKALLTLSLGIVIAGAAQAQTIYYSQNFNSTTGTALPTGWSQTGSGWKSGTAATLNSDYFGAPDLDGRMLMINDDGDNADYGDELVSTPSIDLSAGTAVWAKFKLTYLGAAAASGSPAEKLTVEASTDGGTTWTVLSEMEGVSMYWEPRYINLSAYAGEDNVKLGFRYNDDGEWMYGAAIENLSVEEVPAKDITLTSVAPVAGSPTAYAAAGSSVNITGKVFNNGNANITAYTVKYQQGSGTVYSYSATGSIAPFTSGTFTHATPFTIPSDGAGVEYPINVWIEFTGDANEDDNSGDAMVTGTKFMPTKRLVFEEGTGTWCQWCPRGTVAMDEFAVEHPGVAAQIAVHNADPMTVSTYDAFIGGLISGYPSAVTDRILVGDPGDIPTVYTQMKDNFGFADLILGEVSVSGTTATIPLTIKPAIDINNAKIAVVVTESNVSGTGAGWSQKNAYSGGGNGPMGGWEDESTSVPGTKFHFVARSISAAGGSSTGVPSSMEMGSEHTLSLTTTLNSSWNADNLQYIVMLMNEDGEVMNSVFTALPSLDPVLSISNVAAGINKMDLYPNPASDVVKLQVDLKDRSEASFIVTDVAGKVVINQPSVQLNAGINNYEVATANLSNGFYFMTINTNKGKATLKFVIAR